jgi:hypothetical protein
MKEMNAWDGPIIMVWGGIGLCSAAVVGLGTRNILLERLVLMTCEMRHNMRSQNLIDVTGSCYSIAMLPSCQATCPYAPTPTRASSMGIAATKLA